MPFDSPKEWGAALGSAAFLAFSSWRIHRNSLPDAERARLFWNDRRYEFMQRLMLKVRWTVVAVMGVAVVLIYGFMRIGMAEGW